MNFNEVFYLRKCKKYYDLRITNYKTDFFDSMLGLLELIIWDTFKSKTDLNWKLCMSFY